MNLNLSVAETLNARLAGLNGLPNQRLMKFVGIKVQGRQRDHLLELARTRHDTADRLGGRRTGFLGQAAEIARPANVSAADRTATVVLDHPGMRRAFEDVTIRPVNGATLLTIPIDGASYGNRIRKGASSRFQKGFWYTSKKGNKLFAVHTPDGLRNLYLGRESVRQKQDRTLLAPEKDLKAAAVEGAAAYLDLLIRQRRA